MIVRLIKLKQGQLFTDSEAQLFTSGEAQPFTREVAYSLHEKGSHTAQRILYMLQERMKLRFVITEERHDVLIAYRRRKYRPTQIHPHTHIYTFAATSQPVVLSPMVVFPFTITVECSIRADGNVGWLSCRVNSMRSVAEGGVVSEYTNLLEYRSSCTPAEAVDKIVEWYQHIVRGAKLVASHAIVSAYKHAEQRIVAPLRERLAWFIHKCGYSEVSFHAWAYTNYSPFAVPLRIGHVSHATGVDYDYLNGYVCYELPFSIKFRHLQKQHAIVAHCSCVFYYNFRENEIQPRVTVRVHLEFFEFLGKDKRFPSKEIDCAAEEWVDCLISLIDESLEQVVARNYYIRLWEKAVRSAKKVSLDNILQFMWMSATLTVLYAILRIFRSGYIKEHGAARVNYTALADHPNCFEFTVNYTNPPTLVVHFAELGAPAVRLSGIICKVSDGFAVKQIRAELRGDFLVFGVDVYHEFTRTFGENEVILRSCDDASAFGAQVGKELCVGAGNALFDNYILPSMEVVSKETLRIQSVTLDTIREQMQEEWKPLLQWGARNER